MSLTVAVDLTEDELKRLESQASVAGLSAQQFVQQAVKQALKPDEAEDILEMFQRIWADVPDEVFATLPTDGAHQHDHYLYGTPKKVL